MEKLNIKAAIKKKGLTAKGLAKDLGMSEMNLSYIINGRTINGKRIEPNPTLDTLQRIATAIGCDLFDLFDQPTPSSQLAPVFGYVEISGEIHKVTTAEDLQALYQQATQVTT